MPPEMPEPAKARLSEMDLHLDDAGHAFANDARPARASAAAEKAHERSLAFPRKHPG